VLFAAEFLPSVLLCSAEIPFFLMLFCRYTATVKAVTPIGYIVTYDDWGNTEEVGAR
jgi:hypothetical protein